MSCDIVFVPNLLTKSADSLIFFEFQNSLIFHSIMTQPVIKKTFRVGYSYPTFLIPR